jgi:methylglutaconyl-CoA hydratase
MFQTLDIEYGRQTASIWLARSESRNALDPEMIEELCLALKELADDTEVRAVLLGGRGGAFCAGADIRWTQDSGRADESTDRADVHGLTEMLRALCSFPKPTVARIQGACMGGGMGLAAACDIAVASRDATFGLPETRLGQIPTIISPYVLRAMGARAAGRGVFKCESFGAAGARRFGFIHDLCEPDELDARLSALMGSFMMAAPETLAQCKRLIRHTPDQNIEFRPARNPVPGAPGYRPPFPDRQNFSIFLEKCLPKWARRS